MKFGDVEVKGQTFEVYVSDRGQFSATHEMSNVHADSLDELKAELSKRIARAKVKVSIPFIRWHNSRYDNAGQLIRGTITGIHASNKNVLVRKNGDKGSEQEYSGHYILPEVEDEYVRLCKADEAAGQALREFQEKYGFDARDAVRKALGGKLPDEEEVAK